MFLILVNSVGNFPSSQLLTNVSYLVCSFLGFFVFENNVLSYSLNGVFLHLKWESMVNDVDIVMKGMLEGGLVNIKRIDLGLR